MTLFKGIAFLGGALLVFQALLVWSRKYGPVGKLADELVINLVLPLVIAALAMGLGYWLVAVWNGTTMLDGGAALLATAVIYLLWRGLGALPGRSNVVPFAPRPSATGSAEHPESSTGRRAA